MADQTPESEGQLFEAARKGDVATLSALLDQDPEKLHARSQPYEGTLLHLAARHLPAVDLLLKRGLGRAFWATAYRADPQGPRGEDLARVG